MITFCTRIRANTNGGSPDKHAAVDVCVCSTSGRGAGRGGRLPAPVPNLLLERSPFFRTPQKDLVAVGGEVTTAMYVLYVVQDQVGMCVVCMTTFPSLSNVIVARLVSKPCASETWRAAAVHVDPNLGPGERGSRNVCQRNQKRRVPLFPCSWTQERARDRPSSRPEMALYKANA